MQVQHLSHGGSQVMDPELPNTCPLCNRAINTEAGVIQACMNENWLEVIVRCTSRHCRHAFVAYYKLKEGLANTYQYIKSLPVNPPTPTIDKAVTDISPDFIRIYGQATAAEAQGLDDVAGPGFRKALEFLLKDYAISLCPADKDTIKKLQLGAVIKNYLTAQKMSVVCARATWLGNDETHYEKRWVGKDLEDLKKLINASAHFIAMERLAADLPTDMPDPASVKP